MKWETKGYLVLLSLALLYDILFTLPPVLIHFGINADIIYRFFQPLCHQMDSRSFHLFGIKLAVCSRCTSIYYGITAGIIAFPLFKPLKASMIPSIWFAAIPGLLLFVDFLIDYLQLGHNTFLSRSVTGGAFGISLAFFIVPTWLTLLQEFKMKRSVLDAK